jgi:plasmid rolling circle replication initiator protein Rep
MDRIAKYSGLKKRSVEMKNFLKGLSQEIPSHLADGKRNINSEREEASRMASELSGCANYLVFHNYYTIEEVKLAKTITCKKSLLCPFCAARRASKQVEKNGDRIKKVLSENKNLIPVMITLTVKNGDDLQERFQHIKKSFDKLKQKRKDAIKGKSETEFSKVQGSMFSYEVTNKGNGWHPHIHMIALLDDYIDQPKLSKEWEAITKDSKIVDIRKVTSKSGKTLDISDALLEVFKYALKFSDLDLELTWEAYRNLKGKRLLGSFGNLYGSTLEPETLLDDLLDDLPYLEMFYTYSKHLGSYELKTSTKKEATVKIENKKEVSQKNNFILVRPENPPSKEVLIPLAQIRGIKQTLSRLDQYLLDNPLKPV